MFRPLSRQIVKALPRSRILTSRPVHTMQVPFSGPPSYDTIRRRFSLSHPDPQVYFTRKRQQEARDRGQYVDIHDIGTDPTKYDVLITDISHQTLETTIAEELGIPYLSKATETDAKKVVQLANGYIHGSQDRVIIPFVVGRGGEARWIFFILDSGAPLTYISDKACQSLGLDHTLIGSTLTIGGHLHYAYTAPKDSHFSDINLLGGDFCRVHETYVLLDYRRRQAKLYFEPDWEMVRKPRL